MILRFWEQGRCGLAGSDGCLAETPAADTDQHDPENGPGKEKQESHDERAVHDGPQSSEAVVRTVLSFERSCEQTGGY